MKTLIKNGTLVTSTKSFPADILIEDEKITRLEPDLKVDSDRQIDATSKLILPGVGAARTATGV